MTLAFIYVSELCNNHANMMSNPSINTDAGDKAARAGYVKR